MAFTYFGLASLIQEVLLLPVSDVVEKVVMGMGCLFQAFLSFGSGRRQDG